MGITDIIGGILSPIKDIIGEVVVDPNKKAALELQLAQLADEAEQRINAETLAQIDVNKTEAQSGSLFVAGWRPFVGWSSGCAFVYSTMVYPTLQYFGGEGPHLDDSLIQTVLLGMLGIGAMRTYEKVKGVSTNNYVDLPKPPVVVDAKPEVVGSATSAKPKKHFHIF